MHKKQNKKQQHLLDLYLVAEVHLHKLSKAATVVVPHGLGITEGLQERVSFHDALLYGPCSLAVTLGQVPRGQERQESLRKLHRNRTRRMLSSAALCVICGRSVSIPRDTCVWQNDHCAGRVYGKISITWHACMAKWQDFSTHSPFLVFSLVNVHDVTVGQNIVVIHAYKMVYARP